MASITLKNLPPKLHRALKERANDNRRSLQSEIVATLEEAVWPKPIRVEEFLERVNRFRSLVKIQTTDDEIRRFKRQGRM